MRVRILAILAVGLYLAAATTGLVASPVEKPHHSAGSGLLGNHPVIGTWFGRAVPVNPFCKPGTQGCPIPPEVVMTPVFSPDGSFIGNDSLTFYAPHTTAHGQWVSRGWGQAEVHYLFLTSDPSGLTGALRFRFIVEDVRLGVATGTTTAYFYPFVDENGQVILDEEGFPTPSPVEGVLPEECLPGVNGCLATFRFKIRRIEQPGRSE